MKVIFLLLMLATSNFQLPTCASAEVLAKWIEPARVEWRGTFWESWDARYFVLERQPQWVAEVWWNPDFQVLREVSEREWLTTVVDVAVESFDEPQVP